MERTKPKEKISTIAAQEDILVRSGLWATGEKREKYAFRLSPDALAVSQCEKQELELVSDLLQGPGGYFDGGIKLYQKTLDPRFSSTRVGSIVRRGLTNGIPKKEIANQAVLTNLPALSRVDLMKTPGDNPTGRTFQIAEIEGDKTHGFGYLTLMDYFRSEFIGSKDTRGITNTLKDSLTARGIDPEDPIIGIVGKSERFYEAEMQVFSNFSRVNGLNVIMVPENEVTVTANGVRSNGSCESRLLLNLPSLTPAGYKGTGIDEEKIFELFGSGQLNCLIPPNRFLGSKGLLALVSNGDNNPDLEEVLQETFDPTKLNQLREFIPQTVLVTKYNKGDIENALANEPDQWVIKQVVSSGMKGVALPSQKDKSRDFAQTALNSPYNFVIQKKAEQVTEIFRFSEPGSTMLKSAPMFMRVELFSSDSGIATVGVTGREVPSVHGATDAIQVPIVYK